MIANYHTHTARCGHARGADRDYAVQAEKAGLKILGFSDHTPWIFFDDEPRDRPIRMKPEELPDYAASIRGLAGEFRGRVEILSGVEAEYYPKYFPRLLELLRENGIRYMILGQHFLGNEIGEPYNGSPTAEESRLDRYVGQTAEGLSTGLFSCLAHPDLIYFTGSDEVYVRHMRRLCRAAKDCDTPLEINLLGLKDGRNYPDERFWRLAAEEGNTVVLGCDAHRPADLDDRNSRERALRLVDELGLVLLDTLPIRSLCE